MKNILAVIGGGRPKGNTEQLVDAFAQGAETAGNQVEKILLRKTEVKGCTGCNACHRTGFCVQKDDFNSLIPKIRKANLIVFASPLYYWTISSQLKAFIDRFYSIEEKELPLHSHEKYAQKDSVLLMTAADHSSGHLNRRFRIINSPWSIILASVIRGCCWQAAVAAHTESLRLREQTICKKRMSLAKHYIKIRRNRNETQM